MPLSSFSRTLVLSIGTLILYGIFGSSFRHPTLVTVAAKQLGTDIDCITGTAGEAPKTKGTFDKPFTNVRPGVVTAEYREYSCTGFTSGAPVKGTVEGTFTISSTNVLGTNTGVGGGWVQMRLEFPAPNSTVAREYDECFGAAVSDTCMATDDPTKFTIPATGNWIARGLDISNGQQKGNNVPPGLFATGFADADGKATLRVSVWRVEQVHTGPNENHLVTADTGPKVTITAMP